MVNSINAIQTTYMFDGIDWDLEHLENLNAASVVDASNQSKQKWGQNFIISIAPAPSATLYKDIAKQLGNNLDIFNMQFYDYAATDSERIAGIKYRIQEMVNTYRVPASKLGIGARTYNPGSPTLVSSPAVYLQAYNELKTTYPDLRGGFVWESHLEELQGWPFANTFGKSVRGL